ncbi:MAG: pentapeptide repeat-containing protein [Planctomycetota bacterium]|nr:pentapeptide repeat-containing protein [Planctomycetota bacterium]
MPYVLKERPRPLAWRQYRTRIPWKPLLPLYYMEWLAQWTSYLLGKWSFLEVLEYSGSLSILIGVIFYFAGAKDRLEQKHYQAWQVINTAQGKGGSGGRIDALQELNADGVPLVGVDVHDAFLQGLQLPSADLRRADMSSADMKGADLHGASLDDAAFIYANLRNANLRGAGLEFARFRNTDLHGADLSRAILSNADLSGVDLREADLTAVADWQLIRSINLANILGVKNAPDGFIAWAKKNGAVEVADDNQWNAMFKETATTRE